MNSSTFAATTRRHSRHALRRMFTLCMLIGGCAMLLVPFGAAWG